MQKKYMWKKQSNLEGTLAHRSMINKSTDYFQVNLSPKEKEMPFYLRMFFERI